MLYQKPKMDILEIETADVIRTSLQVNDNHDIENPPDYSEEDGNIW